MQRFRRFPLFLRCWLALSLALAPSLSAQAMATAAPVTVVAAEEHAGHAGHVMHGDEGQASGCSTQHACQGLCCAGCAHVSGVAMVPWLRTISLKPVLIPTESQLLSRAAISRRDRPPRTVLA